MRGMERGYLLDYYSFTGVFEIGIVEGVVVGDEEELLAEVVDEVVTHYNFNIFIISN